jgi:phage major head subunit gpT-like protein
MIVTNATLDALRVGFSAAFQAGMGMARNDMERVAMTIMSTTASNTYGWLKDISGLREWIGPRVIDALSEASYTIVNRDFEKTVGVDRKNIEDDNLGIYKVNFEMLGRAAAALPQQMVFDQLKAGFSTNCWDGQFFFDTDHPILLADGTTGTYANTDGGTGTAWFLICSQMPIKPIIFQLRKPPEFVAKDRPEDDNVFLNRQFLYGVDMRCNVGFGLPQLAWGSKQPLNAANYAAGRAAIMGMKGEGGRPLGLVPDLLVVPPSLESAARKIVNSEYGANGETNEWKDTAELLVTSWLA